MEFEDKKAIYLQIADYVTEQILRDVWPVAEKIPSIRDLAVDLSVNPNTVMRTYAYLVDQNIIQRQRGIGYFVSSDAKKVIVDLKKQHFYKAELPLFFKTIELLGISMQDLLKLYEDRNNAS